MLISLHVKNLALIEETEVFFDSGLNILTGETGAGKSIILGSVNLALGAKADKDLIRTGADSALVELIFCADERQRRLLLDQELPVEEDGTVILQRRILPGRSVCKVNGETVSARQLKDLASVLIDIYGQNEHQTLLHKKKHLEILDAFGKENVGSIKERVREEYKRYQTYLKKEKELYADADAKEKELALAAFEWKEIEEAALVPGEDEKLETDFRRMSNAGKIAENLSAVYGLLSGEGGSAGETVGRALRELSGLTGLDEKLEDFFDQLTETEGLLSDLSRSVSEYLSQLEFDGAAFTAVESRLNLINRLKEKYGRTIEDILIYRDSQQEKLDLLNHLDEAREENSRKLKEQTERLEEAGERLHLARKKAAAVLEKKLTGALLDLNFLDVRFQVAFSRRETFSQEGTDEVEFMISTNPGEPVKPLGTVASGGELSRIMLAFKTVSADTDDIETLIFDEIDTGISGKTAWKVAEKMGRLGKAHQIICITHLPQIAAMADSHFVIEKTADSRTTTTGIRRVTEEELLQELARMLGGESVTDAVLANARELKELAAKTKQY